MNKEEFLIELIKLYLSIIGFWGEDIPIIYLFNSELNFRSKFFSIIWLFLSIKILILELFAIAFGISANSSILILFISRDKQY